VEGPVGGLHGVCAAHPEVVDSGVERVTIRSVRRHRGAVREHDDARRVRYGHGHQVAVGGTSQSAGYGTGRSSHVAGRVRGD